MLAENLCVGLCSTAPLSRGVREGSGYCMGEPFLFRFLPQFGSPIINYVQALRQIPIFSIYQTSKECMIWGWDFLRVLWELVLNAHWLRMGLGHLTPSDYFSALLLNLGHSWNHILRFKWIKNPRRSDVPNLFPSFIYSLLMCVKITWARGKLDQQSTSIIKTNKHLLGKDLFREARVKKPDYGSNSCVSWLL